ncbi:rRNA maturation RNase YbeY [Mollicutes bacterium LVI A0078]|nr:rRNA maturation RNase YbeY [Mollicutes bacterium LVI A0075]WOO90586.1 rRNA maturation RNase YbeY [Mollicutes bacterium LVI A0078]
MNYLHKQVSKDLQLNDVMKYLISYFEHNSNNKVQIAEICNQDYNFEDIDRELTKLVSRGLINEFYVTDNHYFEYTTSNEIDNTVIGENIIDELKAKGYRITDSRKKLIKIFTSSPNSHFTFDELVKLSGKKVNLATMYNNLSTLLDEGVINEFHLNDSKIFELNNKSHAHFICEKCNSVFNVDTKGSSNLENEVEKKYSFKVNTKRIEFTGLCNDCNQVSMPENITVINDNEYPNIDEQEIIEYFGYLQSRTNNNQKGITLVFLDTDSVHNLNNEFRGIDRPTDVLTFVEDGEDYLGDVLICYDYIQKQADEYGHSFKRELFFLITHGYLHLIGYDHIEPEEEKEMFAIQTELLNKYGVSRDE